MSEYRVLARKYRPTTFDDLKGQEHMVRVFANAFKTDKIHHAYLLTGIRGIGKTTTARIIAMGLNCLNSEKPTTQPCKECENCKAIMESRHIDVLEMDAASRTGVDDIRDLIENIPYLPTNARYKVYIIDEVHMLTKNAFNALLKTLEEPPPHVKFIFATTEIRKIPITILSRCQRFDLRRLDVDKLAEHLVEIAEQEGFEIENQAAGLIASAAEGSVRDGLSILDQAISYSENGKVELEQVQKMLCLTDKLQIFDVYEKMLNGKVEDALALVKELYLAGGDPVLITQDLMEISHLLSRIKLIPSLKQAVDIPEAERNRGAELADKLSMSALARVWQMLVKGLAEVKNAPSPLMALEMLIIRIAHLADMPTPIEIADKIESEKKKSIANPITPTLQPEEKEYSPKIISPASFEELFDLFEKEPLLQHYLKTVGLVSFEVGKLEICPDKTLPNDFTKKAEDALAKWTGQSWKIIISDNNEKAQPSIEEQKKIKEEEEKEAVKNHPLVQKVLETFPDAKLY